MGDIDIIVSINSVRLGFPTNKVVKSSVSRAFWTLELQLSNFQELSSRLRICINRGTWVAQSIEHQDLGSV